MRTCNKGFTLVEVLIGVFLLTGISTAMLLFLRSARKDVEFGAEHFTALLLSQKVTEDCSQEIAVNPNAFVALGFDPGPSHPTPVVDGESIYFTMLTDRSPPWGEIRTMEDGKLDSSCQPLYSQMKEFLVGIEASRYGTSGIDRDLYQADVTLQWKAAAGPGRFKTQLLYYSPQTPKQGYSPISIPDAEIEKEICISLYQAPSKNLTQLLSEGGGDRQTIMALGKILVYCNAFLDSACMLKMSGDIAKTQSELKKYSATQYDEKRFRLTTEVASGSYEIARTAFQFLHSLTPEVRTALGNFDQSHLGSTLWDNVDRPKVGFQQLKKVYQMFLYSLQTAKTHGELLLETGMIPYQDRRREFQTLLKVLNISKILVFVPDSSHTVSGRETLLKFVSKQYENKDPYLTRFAQQELDLSRKPTQVLDKSPSLRQIVDSVSWKPNLDSLLQGGGATPGQQ